MDNTGYFHFDSCICKPVSGKLFQWYDYYIEVIVLLMRSGKDIRMLSIPMSFPDLIRISNSFRKLNYSIHFISSFWYTLMISFFTILLNCTSQLVHILRVDKIAAILHAKFSDCIIVNQNFCIFSEMVKEFVTRVLIEKSQKWFRTCLGIKQETSHYQYWLSSMTSYGISRPQWVHGNEIHLHCKSIGITSFYLPQSIINFMNLR